MRKYFNWAMSLTILTYLIIAIALVILLTGCSEFEKEMMIKRQYMESYPFTMCDENESLLICDSEDLVHCWGYLEEEPIIPGEDL
jgi:hypothetical protein